MIALCASPAPVGGGGACDAPVLSAHKFATLLCTGNATLAQPGHPGGGAKPLGRLVIVACQSFCPKIVTVFMSAFKSTEQVLVGESDNGDQDQSSRIL